MTMLDQLKAAGVFVGNGSYTGDTGKIENVGTLEFLEMAKRAGFAFHQDLPDLQLNTGAISVDRELYVTAKEGLVFMCTVQGE